MDGLAEVHWHDSEIESVFENPSMDELIYNIQYPENWDENIFVPKSITFFGYHSHSVEEMPFEGNPTILSVVIISEIDNFVTLKLETTAGNRFITAKGFTISNRHDGI